MPLLSEVVDLLHSWYPPSTAESWDAVGLVSGDPRAEVATVMFAVDPTPEVAQEAVARGAELLVVHHPLFLDAVHSVAASTPKGRTLHTLSSGGCALLTAHTNADQAVDGVSEALARAIGLSDLSPLRPAPGPALDKVVTFVPHEHADAMRAALNAAGAGEIGDYDSCTFSVSGEGRFRPLVGSSPAVGEVGSAAVVPETRIEAVLPRSRRAGVVRALLGAHPYEEPVLDVIELSDPGTGTTGTGRTGSLPEMTLRDFAAQVAACLPPTAHGVRVGGDPDRVVRRVAVCGGAGDFLLDDLATSEMDAYVTSDLRHHRAGEFLERQGPALVDVAHWAAEWTWLPVVEGKLRSALGDTVSTYVSTHCTDPWQFRA